MTMFYRKYVPGCKPWRKGQDRRYRPSHPYRANVDAALYELRAALDEDDRARLGYAITLAEYALMDSMLRAAKLYGGEVGVCEEDRTGHLAELISYARRAQQNGETDHDRRIRFY